MPTLILAQDAPAGGGLLGFLPIIIIIGVFWFLLIRPQQRARRDHTSLVAALKQGDRVIAAGGLMGTIRRVDDDIVSLQVAENVVLKVDKSSVTRKVD